MNLQDFHEIALKVYPTGTIVEVTEDSIRAMIRKAEDALGIQHRESKFGITYLLDEHPDEEPFSIGSSEGCTTGVDLEHRTFFFHRTWVDAGMLHEATHYVLAQEGLWNKDSSATFYGGIMDELVPVHVVHWAYGPSECKRDGASEEGLKEKNPKIVQWIRLCQKVEQAYHTPGFQGLANFFQANLDLRSFIDQYPLENNVAKSASEVMSWISEFQALRLHDEGIAPSEVFSSLQKGLEQGFNWSNMYWTHILLMHRP